jgi:hypothetical protein
VARARKGAASAVAAAQTVVTGGWTRRKRVKLKVTATPERWRPPATADGAKISRSRADEVRKPPRSIAWVSTPRSIRGRQDPGFGRQSTARSLPLKGSRGLNGCRPAARRGEALRGCKTARRVHRSPQAGR